MNRKVSDKTNTVMKYTRMILLLAATALGAAASAQQTGPGGIVFNHDQEWATDLAQIARPHVFGTARSMAMGGAFTSLGGDLSSMSLNPAGLGMYRRNELSLTPMLAFSSSDTEGLPVWRDKGSTRFAMANFGAAVNLFESSRRSLTSLTLGIGMNRVADFNARYSFSSESRFDPADPNRLMPTVADAFCTQLNYAEIFPDKEGHLGYMNPFIWPATLAYNGYVIDAEDEWVSGNRIGSNASVLHSSEVVTAGSINEFDLSLGANFDNVLYVGATIGIQSVHKRTDVSYQEEYGYFDNPDGVATRRDGSLLDDRLTYMNLWQRTVLDGSGVNFKLGAVLRPVAGLRLGVAFHTPTYYSLERSYRGDISSQEVPNVADPRTWTDHGDAVPEAQYDEGPNSWNFTSPARLLLGASYTFGQMAVLSVDYERDWYNGMRMKNVPYGSAFSLEDYKQEFKENFRATNALRVGLEVKPVPVLALRAGGGLTTSMLRDDDFYTDDIYSSLPVTLRSHYFSAGVGIALSRSVTLDLAYQYMAETLSRYQLFFYREGDTMSVESGAYETSLTRHFAAMTLSFRF